MKPNFALKLSNDGIELVHRDAAGWLSVGAVHFATDDVAEGCARLVAEAERLEPSGLCTKLVLPESEVRYATVLAPGPTDEARRYQIEAEIEALTPYSIDELVYDWVVEDDHALIVICARETLAEAEQFAEGYGFNPVSFVAAPEAGQFPGEPYFGETTVARAHLPAGVTLSRDAEPVRVSGRARKAAADPVRAEASMRDADNPQDAARETPRETPAETAAPTRSAPIPAAKTAEGAVPKASTREDDDAPASAAAPAAASAAPASPRPAPATSARSAPAAPLSPRSAPAVSKTADDLRSRAGGLVRRMGNRLRREQAAEQAAKNERATIDAPKPVIPDATASAKPVETPAPRPVSGPATPPVVRLAPGKSPAAAPSSRPEIAAGPGTKAEGTVAFASRRRPAPSLAASGPGADAATANPGGRIAVVGGAPARTDAASGSFAQRMMQQARRGIRKTLVSTGMRKLSQEQIDRQNRRAERRRVAAPEPIVPASRPPVSEREKASEAEALTIFGARGKQQSGNGMARRGLMAAGGLMLVLVAIAVWALYFRAVDPDAPVQLAGTPDGGQVAATPDAGGAISAPATVAVNADAPTEASPVATPPETAVADADTPPDAGDTQTQSADAVAVTDDGGVAEADPETLIEALVQEAVSETLPTEFLDRAAQADGATAPDVVATGAAPEQPTQPAVAVAGAGPDAGAETPQLAASATPTQRLSLPAGLPVPPVDEVAFTPPAPPPPFGTEFTFDAQGLVEATPEGALTPSGVTVFAGRPDVVPAPRPAGIAPEPAAPEPVAETALPPDFPRADPALADARPQPRSARVQAIGAERRQQQPPEPPAPE
ncbi:hypothetical protein, partial [Pararhodobacter sp.]